MSADKNSEENVSQNDTHVDVNTATQELLAFKVAQEAKKQVISWAKWILGVALAILAILGLRAYSDFQSKINGIDQKVERKVEEVLIQKQEKINDLTEDMLDHYVNSLVETQFESKATIEDSKKAAETVKAETKLVMDLLNEYKDLIDRYKTEAETTRVQLLALSKRESPVSAKDSVADEIEVFGNLRYNTLGISAARGQMIAYDALINGKYVGVFINAFITALDDSETDTNGDGKISIKEAFDASVASIDQRKYPMQPVLSGERRSFTLGGNQSTTEEGKPEVKVNALIVGINEYRDAPLRSCVNDANQFAEYLKRHPLYSDERVRILFDKNATKANIEKGLQWLLDTSAANESAIFFFSGHLARTLNKQRQSVAAIYTVDSQFFYVPQIAEKLSESSAFQKIILID